MKDKILKLNFEYSAKPTKDFSEIPEKKYGKQEIQQWFEIFQKETLIGYFSELKYASEFIVKGFKADRIRE
ncbi:MAG: hypothetical protein OQK82_03810 [Candidatus Pacearchaeota archaeon]|nr:hypothetical protein [Candidatus Pacearchaeota archaeon]